jgi:hypothetical protein
MVATLLGSGVNTLAETRWPRKSTSGTAKVHFSKLMTKPAACSRWKTSSTSSWCCSMKGAGYDDIVNVYECEDQPGQHPIHEPLEGAAGVAQPEGKAQEFEEPEWCDDGSL